MICENGTPILCGLPKCTRPAFACVTWQNNHEVYACLSCTRLLGQIFTSFNAYGAAIYFPPVGVDLETK